MRPPADCISALHNLRTHSACRRLKRYAYPVSNNIHMLPTALLAPVADADENSTSALRRRDGTFPNHPALPLISVPAARRWCVLPQPMADGRAVQRKVLPNALHLSAPPKTHSTILPASMPLPRSAARLKHPSPATYGVTWFMDLGLKPSTPPTAHYTTQHGILCRSGVRRHSSGRRAFRGRMVTVKFPTAFSQLPPGAPY